MLGLWLPFPRIFSVKDKSAIVSGGHTGLGKVMAEALMEAGAHVAECSRRPDKWAESFAELKSNRVTGATDNFSVSSVTSRTRRKLKRWSVKWSSKLGSVEILVNNAGVTWIAPADKMTLEDWAEGYRFEFDWLFHPWPGSGSAHDCER